MDSAMNKQDIIIPTQDAARLIGAAPSSLKQSRYTGLLFGKPAPKFIKMGRSARYKLVELLKFRDQFPEYENTSQIAGDNHESV
jgi:hypothetical protein|tara:strand:- start:124 stop:375 length:252 start_codon:yes stop_codon:yes gene_type:complete